MKAIFLAILLFFFCVTTVSAQEELKIDPITPTPTAEVSYTLPYPGILPDNPLYSMKAARDRIISFFIADPLKKAEFDLLQADKRLQAGLFLLHKDNPDVQLAINTISKGQNYLEEAVAVTIKAKKEADNPQSPSVTGMPVSSVGELPDKLHTASRKHTELLQKEASRIPGENQPHFQKLIQRSQGFVTSTAKLQGK